VYLNLTLRAGYQKEGGYMRLFTRNWPEMQMRDEVYSLR
jgi:hypothetical protein